MFPITHRDRSRWQQRAVGELAQILRAHGDLPVIAWTIGPAGSDLVGHVNGLAPAAQVRAGFEAWRRALKLGERSERACGGGIVCLRAHADRHQVRVAVIATVFDEDPGVMS